MSQHVNKNKQNTHRRSKNPLENDAVLDSVIAEDLTERNIALVAQIDKSAMARRSPTDRVVDIITAFCGSMSFVWVHLIWFGGWIFVNVTPGLGKHLHFDPYPFQLLTLVVSLEAIFLSTFILISQNRQGHLADRRNHLDLQINLLSEQENTKMLQMLEAIQDHLGIKVSDPDVAFMESEIKPDHLVDRIEKVIETNPTVQETLAGIVKNANSQK
ncbi:hypothetical protein CCAX7_63750 [Capsulimonas corticalis]|uniref:Uncharacterized protein n=1 Tax=Capsulimonas corticalis TaxID=2219043 RepID=A0A402CWY2_9BACT|nr:DUF1003 domain-containing protein [Capsulimonas corticalis]BDI34324.1 hypothetical protein CCAX7_63750 [Capsulimonas corticalis]